ncbi:MAG: IMP dehydrogenase [Ignavibacteriae bacterium]|nr:IMP dehydrogenase [Ignavibacteriota bacterium]
MLVKKTLYGFDDVTIMPTRITYLKSRSEVKEDINKLLWASPMDTVIDENNYELFHDSGVNVPIVRGMWKLLDVNTIPPVIVSLTIKEARDLILGTDKELQAFRERYVERFGTFNLLIDVANGHMDHLIKLVKGIKTKAYKTEIGVGNIANPDTYIEYVEAGCDWIRVGIGTGSRCHTSSKTSVHYPMISLLDEIKTFKQKFSFKTKIIADGGFRDSSDIVKALAVGADGVMLGSIFNKTIESAGQKYIKHNTNNLSMHSNGECTNEEAKEYFDIGTTVEVDYRGMSTIAVQEKENGSHKNYEEGFSKRNVVKYTLEDCLYEINYAVKSAFSYCNAKTLKEFQEKSKLYLINNLNNHNRL